MDCFTPKHIQYQILGGKELIAQLLMRKTKRGVEDANTTREHEVRETVTSSTTYQTCVARVSGHQHQH